MIGTAECVYETPCGWCSKWDKKCDKKTQGITKGTHTWSIHHVTESEIVFQCDKCGTIRAEPMHITIC